MDEICFLTYWSLDFIIHKILCRLLCIPYTYWVSEADLMLKSSWEICPLSDRPTVHCLSECPTVHCSNTQIASPPLPVIEFDNIYMYVFILQGIPLPLRFTNRTGVLGWDRRIWWRWITWGKMTNPEVMFYNPPPTLFVLDMK